jgi:predicted ATPase
MHHQLGSEASAASIGIMLRGFRVRAGLTQEALAARAGLGVATLKALERDQRQRPHPNTVALLANALELAPEERVALMDIARPRLSVSPVVRERRGSSARELLLEYLQTRRMLLVLDNFEHLLEAAPLLSDIVHHCQATAALATSRRALGLRGEHRYVVSPLAVPSVAAVASPGAIDASPAVRLFVVRAQEVVADFAVTSSNAADVADICRRLDGMPLAIELAAARVSLLSPHGLLQRLERSLPLLVGGAQDLPERQQALRTTLAWSHNLLDFAAQVLFRRLAVFVGGWTLEAAETVCADEELATDDVLDGLQVLVDSSLVRCVAGTRGGPRFGMLETVHEYASEQLVQSGEAERVRAGHADFYARLACPVDDAAQAWPWVWAQSPERTYQALDRLDEELDNLNAALDWLVANGRVAEGLQFAVALNSLWSRLGQYAVGRRWLESVLDLAERTAPADAYRIERAVALTEVGTLASRQGDNERSRAAHRKSVALWREQDHAPSPAVALTNLGVAEWVAGDVEQGTALLEEALLRSREANSPHNVAVSLRNLGLIARWQGQLERAEALFQDAAAQALPPGWFGGYSKSRSLSCLARVGTSRAQEGCCSKRSRSSVWSA